METGSQAVEHGEEARSRRRGARIVVGGLLVAVVVAGVATLSMRRPAPLAPNQKRVTVAAFTYGIPDPSLNPVGAMIPDWLTRALAATGLVDVVQAQTSPTADSSRRAADSTELASLARVTGAKTIIAGEYCRRGDSLEIEARLVDAATGKLVRAIEPVRTPIELPLQGIDEVRARVMAALAPIVDAGLASPGDSVTQPNYIAYAEFLDGMKSYQEGDENDALRHLRKARSLDTTFLQPLLVSAQIYAEMRPATVASGDKADSVLRLINARRQRLGPLDRAVHEWLSASRRGDRLGALGHLRRASRLWPDRYLFEVGHEAYRLNRPGEAVAAFRRLDPTKGFLSGVDEYFADYVAALHALGRDNEALAVALEGRKQYPARASTLFNEAMIRGALGQEDEVAKLLDLSLELPEQPDRVNATPGDAMLAAGYELKAHGNARAALGILDRAAEWFARQREEVRVTPETRKTLMEIDLARGRDVQAAGECRDMLRRRPSDAYTRWCVGMLAARRGQRAVADSVIEVLERMSGGRLPPVRRQYQAEIAAALGDKDRAVTLLRKGFASGLPFGVEHHANPFFQPLVGYPAFDELIKPKG